MITNFAELDINQYIKSLGRIVNKAKLFCGGPGFKAVEVKQNNIVLFKSFNTLIKAVETVGH
jgi:hypothetical protein